MISGTYRKYSKWIWYNVTGTDVNFCIASENSFMGVIISEDIMLFGMDEKLGTEIPLIYGVPEKLKRYIESEFFEIDYLRYIS